MVRHPDEAQKEEKTSGPDLKKGKTISRLTLAAAGLCLMSLAMLSGCAPTEVYRIRSYSGDRPLPRPERVLVYDFAVSSEDVKLSSGPGVRQLQRADTVSQTEEQLKVGREVADSLAAELVNAIGKLGFPAERARRGARVPRRALAIDGQFVHIEEGSRTLRMLIGFGAGASEVRTLVQVYMRSPDGKILVEEFETKAESSRKPGLGVTMGAGAVAGVITAAGAAAGGAASGVMETKASVNADARRTADEIAKHLADLFLHQGWIPAK